MKTYKFSIKGLVQGVYFRAYTKEIADNMLITGYVKNIEDGSVLAVANLKDGDFEDFKRHLKTGSPSSKVTDIDASIIPFEEFENFEIRY